VTRQDSTPEAMNPGAATDLASQHDQWRPRHREETKVPRAFIRTAVIQRSPAGKADYQWARRIAIGDAATAIA
jgi:hypothetical protein